MKRRTEFSQEQITTIKTLISNLKNSNREEQKKIRRKIRELGFYISDHKSTSNNKNYTVAEFNNLIKNGIIKVIGKSTYDFNKVQTKSIKQADQNTISKHNSTVNIEDKVLQFIKIDPKHQDLNSISHQNGIYIFTLRKGCNIPDTQNKPEYKLYEGQRVLYIGQTKSGLNSRINKKHFNGRAGSSTLRKSLGCLLGFKLIPRSKKNPDDGKTTLEKCDEIKLSQWMRDNLIVYYAIVLDDIDSAENKFINSYSPPLNLSKVPMDRNQGFRSELSSLRSMK